MSNSSTHTNTASFTFKMERFYSFYHWLLTKSSNLHSSATAASPIVVTGFHEDLDSSYGSTDYNANYIAPRESSFYSSLSYKYLFEDEVDNGVILHDGLFEQLKLAIITKASVSKIKDIVETSSNRLILVQDEKTGDSVVHLAIRHEHLTALRYFLGLNVFNVSQLKVDRLLSNVLLCSGEYIHKSLEILVEYGVDLGCILDDNLNNFAHLCGSNLKSKCFTVAVNSLIVLGYGYLFCERNRLDLTPLHVAIMGKMDIEMEALRQISLQCKFNFNERVGPEGNTLLHHVARWGVSKSVAENIIRLGGDWTQLNNYLKSVVHSAVAGANEDILEYFFELGCNVNGRDFLGRTPLHHLKFSKEEKLLDITTILLEYGADLESIDDGGNTVVTQLSRKLHESTFNNWKHYLKSLGYDLGEK